MTNIYSKLGFSKAKGLIYQNTVINEARDLFNLLPLKNISLRQLIVEQTLFEESFAISTAEDSELTVKEARKIEITPETEMRLNKYRDDKSISAKEKYNELEFENILNVESDVASISFKELSTNLLLKLHYNLTIGMDEYCKDAGVSHYSAGELRKSNSVRVGKIRVYQPPDHRDVGVLLKLLFKDFANRKNVNLSDILEFHILLYAIHPFSNGNKRVARVLESMLLHHYGYGAERTLSLSVYYQKKKESYNLFLMESLRRKDVTPFINFGIRGYFYSGKQFFQYALDSYINDFRKNFIRFIQNNIPQKKITNYKIIPAVVVSLNGVFTHGEFIAQMKKHGLTLGVSQEILKFLTKKQIFRHKDNLYFVEKAAEINEFIKKLTQFFLQYNISVED